ncbi:MAG TPA: thiamine pyrophosphate-dependent dehydrogenase E1 component subunit alpha [Gemmatimonadales bacterium]|jgi:2-oxoisovalerate dehydrogenase E1 component
MKRFPAYDPPEYVDWKPDPALTREFDATIRANPDRAKLVDGLDEAALLDLYAGLVRTRMIDTTLKRWVRTGMISKAWLGIGEEAATVGPVHALDRGSDYVAPMIRNSGACNEMGMPIANILRGYLGTADGPSRGRDGHYGDFARHILPPISHVGDMVVVATGIALAAKMRLSVGHLPLAANESAASGQPPTAGRLPVVMTWIGDGSTKTGVSHEGFNFAAVQHVPAIFIVQNNRVALGTRLEQHHLPNDFAELPASYGMWGAVFDGNNVLDAWATAKLAVERCRAGEGPAMLIANTFRMGGHATHDEREARATFPPEWFAEWGKRDPVGGYEEWLKTGRRADGQTGSERLQQIEAGVEAEVAQAETEALASKAGSIPLGESALEGVYAS